MSEDLKKTMQRLIEEAYNNGNLEVLDELIAPGYRRYQPPMKKVEGVAGYKTFIADVRNAYSNLKMEIEEILRDGDKTVTRVILTGKHTGKTPTIQAPPTGRDVAMKGCTVSTWEEGKIVEEWAYNDYMGLSQQFGVMPVMTMNSFE
ncbi:MAG: ester cyclase [Desulfofustis sp.]|jgi:predicted ester cyclase